MPSNVCVLTGEIIKSAAVYKKNWAFILKNCNCQTSQLLPILSHYQCRNVA
jgi:aspartate-semialdehyde dehydrogenase